MLLVALLKDRNRPRLLTLIAIAVLLLLGLLTLGLANTAGLASRQKTVERYQWDTEQISDRIQDTLNDYSNLLYSGRSFVLNSNAVAPPEWTGYYRNQDVFNRYKGLSSVGYISIITPAEKAKFEAQMRAWYGAGYALTPTGSRDVYAAASLFVAANSMAPSGFDVYSTPDRRAVYQLAQSSGLPAASGQFQLSSGETGMFAALPVTNNGVTEGFVMVSLHSSDFFEATINPSKLSDFAVKVTDVTQASNPEELYASGNWNDSTKTLRKADTIKFGGRSWTVEYQAPAHYNQANISTAIPYMIMVLGFLLIAVIALFFYIFTRLPVRHDKVVIKKTVNEVTTTTTTEE